MAGPFTHRSEFDLTDDARNTAGNGVLRDITDNLVSHLSPLKEQQCRDPADAIAHGGRLIAVYVHLHHLQLSAVLRGNLIDDRCKGLTGTTPCGPEIYQHRLI